MNILARWLSPDPRTELRAAASVLRAHRLVARLPRPAARLQPAPGRRWIPGHPRRDQPDVVVTFGPDGAADIRITSRSRSSPRRRSWPRPIRRLCAPASSRPCRRTPYRSSITSRGRSRRKPPIKRRSEGCRLRSMALNDTSRHGPTWAITTQIDTRSFWTTVWQAVLCHESQVLRMSVQKICLRSFMKRSGQAVVLSRVQHSEWWTGHARLISSKDHCMTRTELLPWWSRSSEVKLRAKFEYARQKDQPGVRHAAPHA